MTNTFTHLIQSIALSNKYTQWYCQIVNRARDRASSKKEAELKTGEYIERHHIVPDSFFINRKRTGRKGWLEGNPENTENYAYLTGQEHFICHWLLTKMSMKDTKFNENSTYALNSLRRESKGQERYETKITGRVYARIKRIASEIMSKNSKGIPKKEETRKNIDIANKKKANDPAIIAKLKKPKPTGFGNKVSNALIGISKTEEHCKALSKAKMGKKTGPCTEIRRISIQKSLKGKRTLEGKITDPLGKTYEELHGLTKSLELKKLRSENMKKIRAKDIEIYCPHCGQISKSRANMYRWHFSNCKLKA